MKKQFLVLIAAGVLAACSSAPQNQPQAPLDTQAVQDYNAKVYSGNTVPKEQRVKTPKQVEMPLNQSDNQPRQNSGVKVNPNIAVGVGYGWGHHHRHWW
ncbi:hypothetical protein C8D76_101326 [Pasteurella langaaensis DSM 22999]|uniref:Lipoprotein n=1 Tax=Alitibacter langaaensis DSM 22999 TaxID=1122935 RepID=A0A2U0THC2_9PAST|nr:hypothetical protein [Pasteurella langaaensis]PVX42987.1 hypothetical protein C8D76_101326 [Pasteurella langaaensis DSM 22999]